MKKSAFSIAELLVTIIILGAISTFVIPKFTASIMNTPKMQKGQLTENNIQFKAQWRNLYHKLHTAASKVQYTNGVTFKELCNDNKCMMEQFSRQLNIASSCNDLSTGNCWHKRGNWQYLNGTLITSDMKLGAGITLIDGSYIVFYGTNFNCNNKLCTQIYADINGSREPNTIGKDIFLINIYENLVQPYSSTTNDCIAGNTDKSNTGLGCSSKFILD